MVSKKRISQCALLIVFIMSICSLTSCAGMGDWTSEPLPGDYVVVRVNSETVELCLPVDETYSLTTPVIATIVTEVAYNDDYIMVKRKNPVDSFSEIKKMFQRDYYIVDVHKHQVMGPYTKEAFEEKCTKLKVSDSDIDWQDADDLKRQEDL